eukprot:767281-Hanusia_phi.AAC.6
MSLSVVSTGAYADACCLLHRACSVLWTPFSCKDVIALATGALATLAGLRPPLSSFVGKEETVRSIVDAGGSVLKGKQDNQAVIQ